MVCRAERIAATAAAPIGPLAAPVLLLVTAHLACGAQGMQSTSRLVGAADALNLAPEIPPSSLAPKLYLKPAPFAQELATADDSASIAAAAEWVKSEPAQRGRTALLQLFAQISRNSSSASKAERGERRAARAAGNASRDAAGEAMAKGTESVEQHILEAINGLGSVDLLTKAHALKQQSEQVAAEMTSRSANRTGQLVQEMALRSAIILAQVQAMERHYMSLGKGGKHVPSHLYPLFPHMHVAGRLPQGAKLGAEDAFSGGFRGGDAGDWVRQAGQATAVSGGGSPLIGEDTIIENLRMLLAVAGGCFILISLVLSANKKTLSKAALGKARRRNAVDTTAICERIEVALAAREVDKAEAAPVDGKAMTSWDATVTAFSSLVGTGLLAMPFAFSQAGLVAVPLILFFVLCSAYTAHLMSWTCNANGCLSLGGLVETAFGRRAKAAINSFLIVELWGYLLSCTVCVSMNVVQLIPWLDITWAVVVSTAAAYGLTFVPSKVLTKMNVLSNAFFIACLAMFILTGLLLPRKAPASDIQWVRPQGLISAAGILVFSPAAHSFYPTVMEKMQEPKAFPQCIRRAYLGASVLYVAVAVPGYLLFGNALQPSAVRNIGADLALVPLPNLGWMGPVAAFGMVIKMMGTTTIVLQTFANTANGVLASQLQLSKDSLNVLVTPAVLVLTAGAAVHFANEIGLLLNLLGSVFCMNIAFVVPVLCYWKLSTEPVGVLKGIPLVGLVVMGVSFAAAGLASVVLE